MKELITLFLENLKQDDESALNALKLCNNAYLVVGATPRNLIDLYDSARDYHVKWPQPLGRDTAQAIEGQFPKDSREGLLGE